MKYEKTLTKLRTVYNLTEDKTLKELIDIISEYIEVTNKRKVGFENGDEAEN